MLLMFKQSMAKTSQPLTFNSQNQNTSSPFDENKRKKISSRKSVEFLSLKSFILSFDRNKAFKHCVRSLE